MIGSPIRHQRALCHKQRGFIINPYAYATGAGPVWLSNTSNISTSQFNSTLTVSYPATVASGDLLILHIGSGNARTVTTPSGWTAIVASAAVGTSIRSTLFYKIASGTEGGTSLSVTLSGTGVFASIMAQIKAGTFNTTTPVEKSTAATGSSSQPNSPSLSPSWGAAKTLWFSSVVGNNNLGNASITTAPLPTGVLRVITGSFSGSAIPQMDASNDVINTATEDPAAWALSVNMSSWIAETVGVRPV